jgi:tartrate-resistant acid phosphatase type 5
MNRLRSSGGLDRTRRAYRFAALLAITVVLARAPRSHAQVGDDDEAPSPSVRADIGQLEKEFLAEKDEKRRVALIAKMTWLPGAPDVLRRIATTDPSDEVAFAAGNAWRRGLLGGVVGVLQGRLDAATDPARRARLARELERYQVFAAGQNLPRFLREAPPVFNVKAGSRHRVRVLAFGDFGEHGNRRQERIADAMARYHADKRFDFAITLGDNFYPAGIATPTDERWRQEFERLYGRMQIPVFATLGNHDWVLADSPAAEILRSNESDRWRMPAGRYSFVAGPVQFFALDTNLVTRAELDWLDGELGRSKARWKIVFGHHPIYSDGKYGDDAALRESLMPILRGRANLYISGHEHNLQHIAPQDGVHFVIAGGGGAGTYPTKPAARSLFAANQNGFAVIEADHKALSVSLVDGDLEVLHRFTIAADATERAAAPARSER